MEISWKIINYLATLREHLTKMIKTGFTSPLIDKKKRQLFL